MEALSETKKNQIALDHPDRRRTALTNTESIGCEGMSVMMATSAEGKRRNCPDTTPANAATIPAKIAIDGFQLVLKACL